MSSTTTVKYVVGKWGGALEAAARLVRTKVFLEEQKVPVELEFEGDDDQHIHVIAFVSASDDGDDDSGSAVKNAIGTARLHPVTGKIGRMACMPAARGRGVGSQMLQLLVEQARSVAGLTEVHLHAQTHARAFYEKAGFVAHGDEYDEAGIPHISMSKKL